MRRSGTVRAINLRRAMAAIETADDGFTVVEILAGEVRVGDKLDWTDGYALGGETYRNVTSGDAIDVCVENHSVGRTILIQQLRM